MKRKILRRDVEDRLGKGVVKYISEQEKQYGKQLHYGFFTNLTHIVTHIWSAEDVLSQAKQLKIELSSPRAE